MLGRINGNKSGETIRADDLSDEPVGEVSTVPNSRRNTVIRIEPRPGFPKKPEAPKKAVAVDRPGFDFDGSTGETTAGTGLGLGEDASEDPRDRSLPDRRSGDVQDFLADSGADTTKPTQSTRNPGTK